MDKDALGAALGKLVAGLYIVSLKNGETEAGFLASWIQQAGFNPPMLTVAFNKERRHFFEMLTGSGNLVVNIMSKENGATISRFFKPAPAQGSIFDELDTFTGVTGVPILKDSIGYLECHYKSEINSGDHYIALLEVVNGAMNNPNGEPGVHIRKNGFNY